MAKPKSTKQDAMAGADEVRTMTIEEVRALPGLLGFVASARAAHDGFYAYVTAGRKVCIVLR